MLIISRVLTSGGAINFLRIESNRRKESIRTTGSQDP